MMSADENNGRRMGAMSRDDYLEELERAAQDMGLNGDENPGEMSEAERLAQTAEPPRVRIDGKPVGTERIKPLSQRAHAFARGLIEGKTQEQAYREAYPDAKAKQAVIKSNAWKLSQDPRVQAMLNEHWGETAEAMVDDMQATKRFVMKTLLHYVKEAKQEGSRLKALELMGKTVGMFNKTETAPVEDVTVSADQLRKELAGHLRLLSNVRPINRAQVLEVDAPRLNAEPAPATVIRG